VRRAQAGFTLLEVIIAMALLAAMLGMAWGGLSFALRGWDTGDSKGRRAVDLQLAQNFLRRELAEVFPMRWKDPAKLRVAFEGDSKSLRFVSTRAAGASAGGLALVGLEVTAATKGPRSSATSSTSVTATAVAVRGTSRRSAISPNASPGPNVRPRIDTCPERTT